MMSDMAVDHALHLANSDDGEAIIRANLAASREQIVQVLILANALAGRRANIFGDEKARKRQVAIGEDRWLQSWLDGVVEGKATMSQRTMSSIEAHGGIALASEEARSRGVHLLQVTDDKGKELVAASLTPFQVIC